MGLVNVEFYGGEQWKIDEIFNVILLAGGRALGFDMRRVHLDTVTPAIVADYQRMVAQLNAGSNGYLLVSYTDQCDPVLLATAKSLAEGLPSGWTMVLAQVAGEPRSIFEKSADPRLE
jgi:hypothetical protein